MKKYRAGGPHRRATSVPAELLARVFKTPGPNLKALVKALVGGVSDPFERVRILHDWVALNLTYDWPAFEANVIPDQSVEAVLRRRTAVCGGYALLFEALCRTAELECATVGGYARGAGLSVDKPEDSQKGNHAWNAVKLEGAWYLLDVTWDGPDTKGSAKQPRTFATTYFLLEPELMIYQHLPTEPAWQLLAAPVTPAQFDKLPWLDGRFFELAGAPIEGVAFSNQVEQELSFFVPHPPDVDLVASVRKAGSGHGAMESADRQWAGLRKEQGGTRVTAAAPSAGDFEILVLLQKGETAPGAAQLWMSAELPADHGYASLSAEFVALTQTPPEAQQLSNRVARQLEFPVLHRPGIRITAHVEPVDPQQRKSPAFASQDAASQWIFVEPGQERTTLTAAFPLPGAYRLVLFASDGKTKVPSAFHLIVEQGSEHGFLSIDPRVLAITGPPLEGTKLSNHVPRTFSLRFRLPKGAGVDAKWDPASSGPSKSKANATITSAADGLTTVSMTFPAAGSYRVTFWGKRAGGRFAPAFSTLVIAD